MNKETEWEKEYKERFEDMKDDLGHPAMYYQEVKSFIKSLLEETRRDERKRCKKELAIIIKKLWVEPTNSDNGYETGTTITGERLSHNQKMGYNKALEDIINQLNNK